MDASKTCFEKNIEQFEKLSLYKVSIRRNFQTKKDAEETSG